MKVQAITAKINQNRRIIKASALAAILALAPLNIAKASELNNGQYSKDKIELTQNNKIEKNNQMPTWKSYLLLFGSAVGMVGTALFCAWEPKNKKGSKS